MADEQGKNKSLSGQDRIKTETFIPVLDEVNQQMLNRFQQQNLSFMKQLAIFVLRTLLYSQENISSSQIEDICKLYEVDPSVVAAELADLKKTYKLLNV